jgi:PAS domain S-box-containing protein
MTTSKKVWLGFGTLMALFVLLGLAFLNRLAVFLEHGQHQHLVVGPRSLAVNELELGVANFALGLHEYLRTGSPDARQRATAASESVDRSWAEYDRLAMTDTQRAAAARFLLLWNELKAIAQSPLQAEPPEQPGDVGQRFHALRALLATCLQDQMRTEAAARHEAQTKAILQPLQAMVFIVLALLALGIGITLFTGLVLSRSVRRDAQRLWKTNEELRLAQDTIRNGEVSRDASLLRQAEEKLRLLTEQRLHHEMKFSDALFEHLPGIIFVMDQQGRPLRWNRAFERATGYTSAEIPGMVALDFVPEEEREFLEGQIKTVFEVGQASAESHLLSKDGLQKTYVISGVRIVVRNESQLICVGIDISDRKKLEEQLRHAQKLEAVGRLAGGVAHDFNNLLTVICSCSEQLLSHRSLAVAERELLESIVHAGERAKSLTRQLLTFSRKQMMEPQVFDLNTLVRNFETMIGRLIGEHISLSMRLDPAIGSIEADPGQIEMVLVNLLVNTRDAMPQGGSLTIETAVAELDEDFCRNRAGCKPGRHVLLSVTDSGCGMTPEVQARIFEPFFTTKEVGQGTGLGLASVYGVIQQCKGYIAVESAAGKGTTFKLFFPQAAGSPVSSRPKYDLQPPQPGCETLLLVEDDAAVRQVLRQVLETRGYRVLEAADGRQAIQLAEQHQGAIDLLLSDVVMPELSGRAVAERVTALNPGIKVLFSSGYTDGFTRLDMAHDSAAFLQKPYSTSQLTQKVRDVLDQRG